MKFFKSFFKRKTVKTEDEKPQSSQIEFDIIAHNGFRVNERSLIEATKDVREILEERFRGLPPQKGLDRVA